MALPRGAPHRPLGRLRLDPAQQRIVSWEVLERHHPRFVQSTTGEVAGDLYYYIANAQLGRFRDGKILPWDSLAPVLVLKTELSQGPSKAGEAVGGAIRSGAARLRFVPRKNERRWMMRSMNYSAKSCGRR